MTNISNFTENADNYFRKGMNALQLEDYPQALKYLTKSYQLQPQLDTFEELVYTYLVTDAHEEVQSLWQTAYPHLEDFYQEDRLLSLRVQTLSSVHSLQDAIPLLTKDLLFLQKKGKETRFHQKALDTLFQRLEIIETIQTTPSSDYPDLIHSLYQKSANSFLHTLKDLYANKDASITAFMIATLKEAMIANYIKSDILHYLLAHPVPGDITYTWFNDTVTLTLSSLQPYAKLPLYRNSVREISAFFNKQDPHLQRDALTQFTLHALTFYPFLDRVISQPTDWLNDFIHTYQPQANLPLNPTTLHFFNLANQDLLPLFNV